MSRATHVLGVLPALAMAAALAGCDSSPTQPSDTSRSGVWTGSISDAANGSGTLRIVLDERRADAQQRLWTGTWTTTFANAASNGAGTLVGGVTGADAVLALNPTQATPCTPPAPFPAAVGSYTSTGVTATATAITGTYVFVTCTSTVSGRLELRR